MSDIHPRSPVEIAAQLWCLPEHSSKEMDVAFASSIASEIDREQRHTDNWVEEAMRHTRNEQFYRGLLVQIGMLIGRDAFIRDDESVSEDVLVLKLPDLVGRLVEHKRMMAI